MRAREICGEYDVIEKLHPSPDDVVLSTMTVQCTPEPFATGDGGTK